MNATTENDYDIDLLLDDYFFRKDFVKAAKQVHLAHRLQLIHEYLDQNRKILDEKQNGKRTELITSVEAVADRMGIGKNKLYKSEHLRAVSLAKLAILINKTEKELHTSIIDLLCNVAATMFQWDFKAVTGHRNSTPIYEELSESERVSIYNGVQGFVTRCQEYV